MARLAFSPGTCYCGPTGFESENVRGCRTDTSRFRPDFLAIRVSLNPRQSHLRCQERVRVKAGLIEKTETELSGESSSSSDGTAEEKVDLNVTNLGNNTRRVVARIAIQAPLEAVWRVLTDYNHLADHIPGLAESRVLELRPNGARLSQIGQKNFALGVKFKAKAVVEVTEEAPQDRHDGILRDLHFDTVEGDFQVFKGTWRMHQTSGSSNLESKDKMKTYLSYILEVRPKRWMPVALIEGVLGHEITCNLVSVRKVALRNHLTLDL